MPKPIFILLFAIVIVSFNITANEYPIETSVKVYNERIEPINSVRFTFYPYRVEQYDWNDIVFLYFGNYAIFLTNTVSYNEIPEVTLGASLGTQNSGDSVNQNQLEFASEAIGGGLPMILTNPQAVVAPTTTQPANPTSRIVESGGRSIFNEVIDKAIEWTEIARTNNVHRLNRTIRAGVSIPYVTIENSDKEIKFFMVDFIYFIGEFNGKDEVLLIMNYKTLEEYEFHKVRGGNYLIFKEEDFAELRHIFSNDYLQKFRDDSEQFRIYELFR